MKKVIDLGDVTNDASYISIEQCLKLSLEDVGKRGAFTNGKKCIVIALDDNDKYEVNWNQAGMTMSEVIALLEITKRTCMEEMGY